MRVGGRGVLTVELRQWLTRIALSGVCGVSVGGLAFLIARAVTNVLLFVRHRQFLGEVAGALSGGVEGLAGGNLRAVRLLVQRIDAEYELLSLMIGFGVAAVVAVGSYVWLEWRDGARRVPVVPAGAVRHAQEEEGGS